MASEIVIALTGLLCTIVSSIVTFNLTKKKYSVEVESQQIQNMNESFEVYKKNMRQTLEEQSKKIQELRQENEELKQQVNQLQSQVVNLVGSLLKDAVKSKPQKPKNKNEK